MKQPPLITPREVDVPRAQRHTLPNADINITLTADIDLTGKDWTPIGTDYDMHSPV